MAEVANQVKPFDAAIKNLKDAGMMIMRKTQNKTKQISKIFTH